MDIGRHDCDDAGHSRKRWRNRVIGYSVGAAFCLGAIAAVRYQKLHAREVSKHNAARELAHKAIELLDRPDQEQDAIAFALRAFQSSPGVVDEPDLAILAQVGATAVPAFSQLLGHKSRISVLSASQDGTKVATGASDSTVNVWSTKTGERISTFVEHDTSGIESLQFTADGRLLVARTSQQCDPHVWNSETGQLVSTLAGAKNKIIRVLALSSSGNRVVARMHDKSHLIWETYTGKLVRKISGKDDCLGQGAVLSPEGRELLTYAGEKPANVCLWNVDSGKRISEDYFFDAVLSAQYSSDGKGPLVATESAVHEWNADRSRTSRLVSWYGDATFATFAPNLDWLAIRSPDGAVKLFSVRGGEVINAEAQTNKKPVFSPDSRRLLSVVENVVTVVDVPSGKRIAGLHTNALISDDVFSSDGQVFLVGGGRAFSWRQDAVIPFGLLILETPRRPALSPSGERLSFANEAGNFLQILDLATGRVITQVSVLNDRAAIVAFAPQGRKMLASAANNTITIWDAESGTTLGQLSGHSDEVEDARFSADGRFVVTASLDNSVRIWDAENGRLLQTMTGHTDRVIFARFSPNGKRVVSLAWDFTARIWNAETGSLEAKFPFKPYVPSSGHTFGNEAVFLPDSNFVLINSIDDAPRLWDIAKQSERAQFRGYNNAIVSLAVSPGGTQLLTAHLESPDAWLWDLTGAREPQRLAHSERILEVGFSPDSRWLATSSSDQTIRLWSAKTGVLVAERSGLSKILGFSKDSQRLVVWNINGASGGTVNILPVTYVEGLRWACTQISHAAFPIPPQYADLPGICAKVPN